MVPTPLSIFRVYHYAGRELPTGPLVRSLVRSLVKITTDQWFQPKIDAEKVNQGTDKKKIFLNQTFFEEITNHLMAFPRKKK